MAQADGPVLCLFGLSKITATGHHLCQLTLTSWAQHLEDAKRFVGKPRFVSCITKRMQRLEKEKLGGTR